MSKRATISVLLLIVLISLNGIRLAGTYDSDCSKTCGGAYTLRGVVGHRACETGGNGCHVTLCPEMLCVEDAYNDLCATDEGWQCGSPAYHWCKYPDDPQ